MTTEKCRSDATRQEWLSPEPIGSVITLQQLEADRLVPRDGGAPLLAVATGSYPGEGLDCPALDTLFLVAPIAFKGLGFLTLDEGRRTRRSCASSTDDGCGLPTD